MFSFVGLHVAPTERLVFYWTLAINIWPLCGQEPDSNMVEEL
jgi:hypothetical protein